MKHKASWSTLSRVLTTDHEPSSKQQHSSPPVSDSRHPKETSQVQKNNLQLLFFFFSWQFVRWNFWHGTVRTPRTLRMSTLLRKLVYMLFISAVILNFKLESFAISGNCNSALSRAQTFAGKECFLFTVESHVLGNEGSISNCIHQYANWPDSCSDCYCGERPCCCQCRSLFTTPRKRLLTCACSAPARCKEIEVCHQIEQCWFIFLPFARVYCIYALNRLRHFKDF